MVASILRDRTGLFSRQGPRPCFEWDWAAQSCWSPVPGLWRPTGLRRPIIRGDIGLRGNAEHAGLPDLPFADLQGQANAATGVSKLGEKCAVAMDPSHPTARSRVL